VVVDACSTVRVCVPCVLDLSASACVESCGVVVDACSTVFVSVSVLLHYLCCVFGETIITTHGKDHSVQLATKEALITIDTPTHQAWASKQ
jgi:hypothetical protein